MMIWLLEGYGPKRFIFAVLRGFLVAQKYARVWRASDGSWNWITYREGYGWAPSFKEAREAAEWSIRHD